MNLNYMILDILLGIGIGAVIIRPLYSIIVIRSENNKIRKRLLSAPSIPEIDKLTWEIVQWANSVFPNRSPESAFLKLYEELGELVRDPSKPLEWADVGIIILDLMHMHHINMAEVVRAKLAINKKRAWIINSLGTLQHIGERDES